MSISIIYFFATLFLFVNGAPDVDVSKTSIGGTHPKDIPCGLRHKTEKKDGGNSSSVTDEFPWLCGIFRQASNDENASFVYHCGGSLIHPKVVVTTAHCIFELSTTENASNRKFKVRLGDWGEKLNEAHRERDVVKVVGHENYNPVGLFNDIALLILDEAFEDDTHPVCLPTAANEAGSCLAPSWNEGGGLLSAIELPLVRHDECELALRRAQSKFTGPKFELHETSMCAGGEGGKDTCTRDSGMPLMCQMENHSGRYFATGIVSWGIGCGKNNVPGVYTNVASLRPWIDEQMRRNSIDLKAYNNF